MKKMLLLFFLVLGSATVTTLRERYAGPEHEDWIELPMSQPGQLQSVTWCAEMFVHQDARVAPAVDINDCKAHNLFHLQIYPSRDNSRYALIPNGIRIKASGIPGFWLNRQMDVIIRVETEPGTMVEQIVMFHPISSTTPPPTTKEEKVQVVGVAPVAMTNDEPTPPMIENVSKQTQVMWIVVAFGTLLVFVTVFLAIVRRKHVRSEPMVLPNGTAYVFSKEEEGYTPERAKRDEDILQNLGRGAAPEFMMNRGSMKL